MPGGRGSAARSEKPSANFAIRLARLRIEGMLWIDDLLDRTLVLVAHPDDECIAFGGSLQRMRDPVVVFATNGSPVDPYFWKSYGSREAYAALRQQEALKSMSAAGVKDVIFLADMPGGEVLVDQELFRNPAPAFDLLADLMRRRMTTALLTLAYEGGSTPITTRAASWPHSSPSSPRFRAGRCRSITVTTKAAGGFRMSTHISERIGLSDTLSLLGNWAGRSLLKTALPLWSTLWRIDLLIFRSPTGPVRVWIASGARVRRSRSSSSTNPRSAEGRSRTRWRGPSPGSR